MAHINATAIIARLREVLEAEAGVLREIPATRFLSDLPEGLSEEEQMRRALEKPRIQASVPGLGRHPQSPPVNGNVLLYAARLQVKIIRTVARLEQLSEADADILRALAIEDMDVVRQALEYPGNLTATEAGVATGIVSGLLRYVDSSVSLGRQINQGSQLVTTLHNYTAVIKVTPEVAPRPPVLLEDPEIEEI